MCSHDTYTFPDPIASIGFNGKSCNEKKIKTMDYLGDLINWPLSYAKSPLGQRGLFAFQI